MTIGSRIKNRRVELGLTVDEVAEKLNKNRATIYRYESDDIKELPITVLNPLADVLHTTPADLMGWDEKQEQSPVAKKNVVLIPILGRVAAGVPIEAVEDIIGWEEIPVEYATGGELFGLRIQGDSMTPRICDGDVVIVRKQDDAESGDLVIATVNGDDATCKRLMKYDNGIGLISINPSYSPMIFTNRDIENMPIHIIGKVIKFIGEV